MTTFDRNTCMSTCTEEGAISHAESALAAARQAAALIPPLWPLTSSVAVNPYLGHTDEPLAFAAARPVAARRGNRSCAQRG